MPNLFSKSILANLFSLPSHSGPLLRAEAGAATSLIKELCRDRWILTANCHLQSFAVSCIPEHWFFHRYQLITAATEATLEFISRKQVVSSPGTSFFCYFKREEYFCFCFLVERYTPVASYLPVFLSWSFIGLFPNLTTFPCCKDWSTSNRRLTETNLRQETLLPMKILKPGHEWEFRKLFKNTQALRPHQRQIITEFLEPWSGHGYFKIVWCDW